MSAKRRRQWHTVDVLINGSFGIVMDDESNILNGWHNPRWGQWDETSDNPSSFCGSALYPDIAHFLLENLREYSLSKDKWRTMWACNKMCIHALNRINLAEINTKTEISLQEIARFCVRHVKPVSHGPDQIQLSSSYLNSTQSNSTQQVSTSRRLSLNHFDSVKLSLA